MFLDHPWVNFLPWNWKYRMTPPKTTQVAKYVIRQNLHIKKSLFDVSFPLFFTTRFLSTGGNVPFIFLSLPHNLHSFHPTLMALSYFARCVVDSGTYLLYYSLFLLFSGTKKSGKFRQFKKSVYFCKYL